MRSRSATAPAKFGRPTAGMDTDGASIPGFLHFALGKPFDPPQIFAGVVHDAACKDIRDEYDAKHLNWDGCVAHRKLADEMFHEACRAAGMSPSLAQTFYAGVRIGSTFGAGMPERRDGDGDETNPEEVFAQGTRARRGVTRGKPAPKMKKAPKPKLSAASAKTAARQQDLADRLVARQARRAAVRSFAGATPARRGRSVPPAVKSAEDLAAEAFAKVRAKLEKDPSNSVATADRQIIAALREME